MLISVFELLADARQQIAAVNAYIETLRDYWIAESELQLAITGISPGVMAIGVGNSQAASGSGPTTGH
jgi:hypothetical protein